MGLSVPKKGSWEWYSQTSQSLSVWLWTPTSPWSAVVQERRSCKTPLTCQDLLRPEALAPCSSAVCPCQLSASAHVRRIPGRCPVFRRLEVRPRPSLYLG